MSDIALGVAVEQYRARKDRARKEKQLKPETARCYLWFLKRLVESFGSETQMRELSAPAIERSAQKPSWGQSTRHDYLGTVSTFLREMGHPLKLRRPPQTSRSIAAVWTVQDFWKIYGAARGDLKPYLLVLLDTGARPSEVTRLTIEMVDWPNKCCVSIAIKMP